VIKVKINEVDYDFDISLWNTHPVLRKGWALVKKQLSGNKMKYGWERFDNEEGVLKWLADNPKSNKFLAKLLVGPECRDINKCAKVFDKEDLRNFPESVRVQYHQHLAQQADPLADMLQEEKVSENKLILENHRKSREVHPVARNNWWYDA
jgi:hypothetical protein